MSEAELVTRPLFWAPGGDIHPAMQTSQYLWLAVAMAVLFYGIYRHIKLWRKGLPEACFDDPINRTKHFLQTVLFQAKVLRMRRERDPKPASAYAAWLHGLIFYGFLGLFFGTSIVALSDYNIVHLYEGWFYLFVTLLCEVSGLALAAGVLMGLWRRWKSPARFPLQRGYTVLYLFLLALVAQGFLIEAIRVASQEAQGISQDAPWSFVGWALGRLLFFNASEQTLSPIYSTLWYAHMVTTMGFVAALPYSRAMHIITSVLNLYTQRLTPPVKMRPLDLENADATHFGPKTVTEFTWKDLLSFDSCTECRRCTDICPANASGKSLDPRAVIIKLRDSMKAENVFLYESGLISHDEIWACTNCGACVDQCPVGIDQLGTIMQLRRYQTLSLGEVPASAGKAIENIKQHNNPWGISHADRFKWAEGMGLRLLTPESPQVEWLYWVGCAGAYDASNQNVTKAVVGILQNVGVDFAVLGKAEKCTGEPVKRLGDEYSFSEIAKENVSLLKSLKFQKIVTHCPHCYNTLKNDYPEYGGAFEVYHHTQLLTALYKQGRLVLPGEVRKDVTFHDPCFLGRHNGEYEAPRELLESIAGLRLTEMTHNRDTSSCCGMGGGNMWYESHGGSNMVENRLEHVAQTGAKTLVTGCSFCLINFKGALKNSEATKDVEVIDIAQAVHAALPVNHGTAAQ